MIALIAEKPSVANDIARLLGARQRKDGYTEGNGYMVTWAFGHLIELGKPEDMGFKSFDRDSLPILPDNFTLSPRKRKGSKGWEEDPGVKKQLKVIKEVFNSCDKIIVATDAGREGELIFRYIYEYLDCHKPFERLWISSLTDSAIREGLKNLKPGNNYDNLHKSALARSQSDWILGINSTQAITVAAGKGLLSLGRVQTPTMCMVCSRWLENKNFTPVKYWQLQIGTGKDNIYFKALSKDKWENKEEASKLEVKLNSEKEVTVKSVIKKEVSQEPPLLYDLTALQKEANSKYGFSAEKTLQIAQTLYEKKFLSYPRTGSRYISVDVYYEIPERIALLEGKEKFRETASKLKGSELNRRSVNDSKVTDHHALIITENFPSSLTKDEETIYDMVAARMLESFSQKCIKDITDITIEAAGTEFNVKGSVIKYAGWRGVLSEPEQDQEDNETLPVLNEGERLPLTGVGLLEKQTKPKPLHTEASLLASMETAGKEIEDSELRASIKECGIGTPATRAQTIEKLLNIGYIERNKKNLIPTENGLKIYDLVKDMKIANVELTAKWEADLSKMEQGEIPFTSFMKEIKEYTGTITEELLILKVDITDVESFDCPKCKNGKVKIYKNVAKCLDDNCDFVIFRNKGDKQLTDKNITDLLNKGKTGIIKGFKNKEGKLFDAALRLDENHKAVYDFSEKKNYNSKNKK